MSPVKDEQLDRFIADLLAAMTRIVKTVGQPGGPLVEKHGLTPPQVFTLWQLGANEPMTMGEFSDLLSVAHGVATRMVDRLVKKGMVERRRDDDDRRVVYVTLTPLGEEVTAEVAADAMRVIREVFKDVPRRDREEYLALLGRIEAARAGESDE
jgi:DNA-binding MarR family transcriptional regulator